MEVEAEVAEAEAVDGAEEEVVAAATAAMTTGPEAWAGTVADLKGAGMIMGAETGTGTTDDSLLDVEYIKMTREDATPAFGWLLCAK